MIRILGNLRNINYEVKNVDEYKEDTSSELFGALGLFSKIIMQKKVRVLNNDKIFLEASESYVWPFYRDAFYLILFKLSH